MLVDQARSESDWYNMGMYLGLACGCGGVVESIRAYLLTRLFPGEVDSVAGLGEGRREVVRDGGRAA